MDRRNFFATVAAFVATPVAVNAAELNRPRFAVNRQQLNGAVRTLSITYPDLKRFTALMVNNPELIDGTTEGEGTAQYRTARRLKEYARERDQKLELVLTERDVLVSPYSITNILPASLTYVFDIIQIRMNDGSSYYHKYQIGD